MFYCQLWNTPCHCPPLLFSKHSPSQNLWKVKQLEDEKLGEASPNLSSVDVHVTIPWNHGHGRVFRVHCSEATDPEHCRVQPTSSQHWLWQFGFGTFEKCRNSEMKGLQWLVKQLFKCGFKQFLIVWGQFWKLCKICMAVCSSLRVTQPQGCILETGYTPQWDSLLKMRSSLKHQRASKSGNVWGSCLLSWWNLEETYF